MRKLMWFTLGFGTACAWGAYFANRYACVIVVASVILAAVLGLLGRNSRFLKSAALICVGVFVGICWFWAFDMFRLAAPRELDKVTMPSTIRVTDFIQETDYGYAVDGEMDLDGHSYDVCVYLDKQEEPFAVRPGDMISGDFRFKVTTNGKLGDSTYHQGNGTFLIAYQKGNIAVTERTPHPVMDQPAFLRKRISTLLEEVFPEDTAAFAKALLLGDSSDLTYEVDTSFKISGIRHIIAVSGLHVSMLFSAVYFLSGKRKVMTAFLGIPVLMLFAAVAGFTPSITRACIMQGLMILALLFDREYDPPTALSFAALVMLLLNPLTVTSVSFQLSVGCMVGIFLFAERLRAWMLSDKCLGEAKSKSLKAKLKRWLTSGVSVTLGAMVVTTPLCAWYFGTVSLVGVVTNLLTLWIVTYIFCGIIAVCVLGVIWTGAAGILAGVISWGIRYVLLAAKVLSTLPMSAVYSKSIYIVFWLIFCYLLLSLFLTMKKKHPVVLAGCVVLSLCASVLVSWFEPLRDDYRVTVLDVGQGQCILLQSEGHTYLVDCGGSGAEQTADEAAATLLSQGILRLDGVIVTHFDGDHSEGVANLLSRIDADVVLLPGTEDESGTADRIKDVTDGSVFDINETMELRFSDTSIRVMPAYSGNSDNESSLCVLFQTENCAILITGDRNAFGERMLLRNEEIPDVDVLIVGHHGSKYSTCEELLLATKPEIAIISVGENNPYGHPAQETLDRLVEFGCVIYRTDLHGTIIYRG